MNQSYKGINSQNAVPQFLPFREVRRGYLNAKELDEENGMYYYSARYYAPPTFISRDPLMDEKPWLSPYHYCSNSPVNRIDPTGMEDDPYLVFNGNTNKLQIFDDNQTPDDYSDDTFIGEYDAHNNTTSRSNGKWEDGKYEMKDKNKSFTHLGQVEDDGVTPKDSPKGGYGKGGIFRAKNFKETTTDKTRSGMGVHAGREHKPFSQRKTLGCIRTTPEAIVAIEEAISGYGSLQSIIIQNNRNSTNSSNVNSITPNRHGSFLDFSIPYTPYTTPIDNVYFNLPVYMPH